MFTQSQFIKLLRINEHASNEAAYKHQHHMKKKINQQFRLIKHYDPATLDFIQKRILNPQNQDKTLII